MQDKINQQKTEVADLNAKLKENNLVGEDYCLADIEDLQQELEEARQNMK